MRNHSSVHLCLIRTALLGIALIALFALAPTGVHAQCADDDNSDSLGCATNVQQPAQSQPGESPAVLTLAEQQKQASPKADRSNDASASNSLTAGSSFSEAGAGGANTPRGAMAFPPEPPTEFQRFVAATTGLLLPVYGARLFAGEAASFAPLERAPAPEQLIVGADDELRIRIWGQVNFSANLRVSREGEIYLPKAGAVHVAGLPFPAVAGHLRTALERVYRNFELSVDMGQIHSIQVYLTGQARRPGEYTVSALSTLVDAIFSGGGPSSAGSMRHVELRREGKVLADFDLYELLIKGDKTGDVQLLPGDVLYFPSTGPQVALLGSVRQPGIFELRGEESIEHLLNEAGGRTAVAAGTHFAIDRIDGHARRRAFELAADAAGLAAAVTDGDIVRIDPIVSSYLDTVTLRGSVANPGRFR